jgi:non-specific serine/threonine protein kinase
MSKLSLSKALDKPLKESKISAELASSFSQFLQTNPLLHEQAVYLLQEKKKKIREIVEDLYGVPINKQDNWASKKNLDSDNSKTIEKFVTHLQKSEKFSKGKVKLFQDCKNGLGLNNEPLAVGRYHPVIKMSLFTDKDLQQKFQWDFRQAKLSKKGWILEKPLEDIENSLLKNPYLTGKAVIDYLKNQPLIKERNFPDSTSLPAQLILDSAETHYFLSILCGYPLLYCNGESPFLRYKNNVSFQLKFKELRDHKLVYITFSIAGEENSFDFELYKNKIYVLGGVKQAIIAENHYWQLENSNILSDAMLQEAIQGVLVAHQEWDVFLEKWKADYDIPIEPDKTSQNISDSFNRKDFKNWFFWLKLKESNEIPTFKENAKIPKFYFSTNFKKFNEDTIGLKVEGFEDHKSCLQSPEKCCSTIKLFRLLKYILRAPQEQGFFLINRVLAAEVLSLAKNYPYIYNHKKQPLFEEGRKLNFGITIEKDPDSLFQYFLRGIFYEKKVGKDEIKSLLFSTTEQPSDIWGVIPSYLAYKDKVFPIENFFSGNFMKDYQTTILAKKEDISDFYYNVYPVMKTQHLELFDPHKLLNAFAVFNYELSGRMEITEDNGILMGKFSAIMKTEIGEFIYPICEEGNTFQKEIKEQMFSIARDKNLEKKIFFMLKNHGWLSSNHLKKEKMLFFMERNSIVDFLFNILPKQDSNALIKYYVSKNFKRWKVTDITSKITSSIKSSKKSDWFELDINVGNYNIDIKKIVNIWKKGSNHIDLGKDKGVVKIDQKWMDNYAPILNYFLKDKEGQKNDDKKIVVQKHQLGLLEDFVDKKRTSQKIFSNFFKIAPQKIPTTIKAELRNYQKEGVSWLCFLRKYHFGGILADDMGLGKTLQALTFFEIIRGTSKNKKHKPHLVICPTSIVSNWQEEVEKFCPTMNITTYYGPHRSQFANQLQSSDLILTTYSLLQKDSLFLQTIKYDVILLDEAQNIKNANTKTSREICSLQGEQKVSLTGTPIENNVTELWSQFYFLMPKLLGSYKYFQQLYIKPNQKKLQAEYNYSLLRKQTKPFILRRIKQNVAKSLPPKTEQILYCEMSPKQRKLYDTVLAMEKKNLLEKIENKEPTQQIRTCFFKVLLKLRQICCDPRLNPLFENEPPVSAKLEFFLSRIEEIVSEGHRVLVFSQFVKMLNLMHKPLEERNIHFLQLDGSTKKRSTVIKQFQNNTNYPVFLISLKAGGVGLNLTAADYVIHYDPWWNPAVVDQASDRVYRIGQDKHVFIYRLITKNSVEEKILTMQNQKKSLSGDIIDIFSGFDNMLKVENIQSLFS